MSLEKLSSLLVLCGTVALLGCPVTDRETDVDTVAAEAARPTEATLLRRITGFRTPESVLYHAGDDLYYVSNINGAPLDRDNSGFITRMSAEGVIDSLMFIAGGREGVTLHAPKGMTMAGDTLWVTDIDVVRGFDRRSGAPVATITLRPTPLFLNDIAVGGDGALYVTDTGIRFRDGELEHPGPNRIYRVSGRQVSVAAEGSVLGAPNGITWDHARQRFLVAPFAATDILEWRLNEAPTPIAAGPGSFDGVEVLDDGRVLISSWADSSIHVLVNDSLQRAITGVPTPADFGIDLRRLRVAIPLFTEDRVEIWALPLR